jgi:hypothetical protein
MWRAKICVGRNMMVSAARNYRYWLCLLTHCTSEDAQTQRKSGGSLARKFAPCCTLLGFASQQIRKESEIVGEMPRREQKWIQCEPPIYSSGVHPTIEAYSSLVCCTLRSARIH